MVWLSVGMPSLQLSGCESVLFCQRTTDGVAQRLHIHTAAHMPTTALIALRNVSACGRRSKKTSIIFACICDHLDSTCHSVQTHGRSMWPGGRASPLLSLCRGRFRRSDKGTCLGLRFAMCVSGVSLEPLRNSIPGLGVKVFRVTFLSVQPTAVK